MWADWDAQERRMFMDERYAQSACNGSFWRTVKCGLTFMKPVPGFIAPADLLL
jgi:hypothetical protein